MRYLACLILFCCSPALADLKVDVKSASVQRTTTPLVVTQLLVAGSPLGEPVTGEGEPFIEAEQPAAVLFIESDKDLAASLVKLRCRTAEAKQVETGVYLIDTPGTHEVEVNVISENPLTWDDEIVVVTVGEPVPPTPPNPPVPPPPDVPDVPEDQFDNLGQRVAEWATGLPDLTVLAGVYKRYAEKLVSDASETVGSISEKLLEEVKANPNYAAYEELRKSLNADLQQRWAIAALDRLGLSEYYLAIAAGLEAAARE